MSDTVVTVKRLNPVVDRYVTTDEPLIEILIGVAPPRSLMVQALLEIEECLAGKRLARHALLTAQDAALQVTNTELAVLFLSRWADLACRIGRPAEAEALIHRLRDMTADDIHPVIKARALAAEAGQAELVGNRVRAEALLREAMGSLPVENPRRKFHVWELALMLARQGRAGECAEDLKQLQWQCNERFRPLRLLLVQFVDAVETGKVQEASQVMSRLAAGTPTAEEWGRINYRGYQGLLALMHQALLKEPGGAPTPTIAAPPEDAASWVELTGFLLARRAEDALRLARLEAAKVLSAFVGTGFEAYGLIRAELAAGHWESAVRLVNMRVQRGNRHDLDDFFMARAERLAGNRTAAARHYAAARRAMAHHQAQGRLDFELALSCELAPEDIEELTKAADAQAPRPTPPAVANGGEPSDENATRLGLTALTGRSTAIQAIRDTIARFADLNAPVLVTGATGTGKELVARALHAAGRNRRQPFLAVNCGSISETLLESELFGHERGAFTGAERTTKGLFEAAGTGTLFLDEIGEISPRLQTALLRVMETGEVRAVGSTQTRKVACRVVAATNADLSAMAERGVFRRDLLYRLERLGIHIPPLRERREDILPLARHFLDIGRRIGVHAVMSEPLTKILLDYDWPGNVRELKNVIERMRLLHSDKLAYGLDDLEPRLRLSVKPAAVTLPAPPPPKPEPAPAAVQLALPPPPAPAPAATAGLELTTQDTGRQIALPDIHSILAEGRSGMRRRERLKALFAAHTRLTRGEIMTILRVSPNTATADLKALCDAGLIRRVEPSRSPRSHYFEAI